MIYCAPQFLIAQNNSNTQKVSNSKILQPITEQQKKALPELQMLEQLEKSKNYNLINDFITQGMVQKDPALVQSNRILSKEFTQKYRITPNSAHEASWVLAYSGYTLEKIQELYNMTGLNLLELNTAHTDPLLNGICISPLVVVARVDSIYIDSSLADGFTNSFALSINETLKGDNSIKKAVIRDNRGMITIQGGKRVYRGLTHGAISLREGKEYIICLHKASYIWGVLKNTNFQSIKNAEATQYCFATSPSLYVSTETQEHPALEQQRLQKIERIRSICQQLAPFFSTIIQK